MSACLSALQESPTGELADFTFPTGAEPSGQASEGENSHPQPQERVNASDDSDGNISEESKTTDTVEGNVKHNTSKR